MGSNVLALRHTGHKLGCFQISGWVVSVNVIFQNTNVTLQKKSISCLNKNKPVFEDAFFFENETK